MQEEKQKAIAYICGQRLLDPDRATVIFIHGAGGAAVFWQAQVDGLSGRVNTVALDLPGHGRSDGRGRQQIEAYAGEVADFMRQLNVPQPVVCGLSMGGAVAQQLMLDEPELVKAGILISTGARLKVAPAIFEAIENDYQGFAAMVAQVGASPKTDPALLEPFKQQTAACPAQITRADFLACNAFDAAAELEKIRLPVLVITAEDDRLTPARYGEFLAKNIPNAERVHIMGAGHIVPLEKPEAVNRAIIDFLDRIGY